MLNSILLILYADDDMVVVLFAASAMDGELVGLVVQVGETHFAFFKDGDDGGVMVEHGERALVAGHGNGLCFAVIEARCWCDDFDVHCSIELNP